MIKNYFRHGILKYVTKRGLLYFELSPVYGLGACLLVLFFSKRKNKKFDYFYLGAIIGGAFEYVASLLQELFTGTISWNYSNYFLNIGGRTTIPYMIFWGLASYFFMTKFYPFLSNKIDNILKKMGNIVYYSLLVIILFDIFISFSACVRLGLRHKGYKPITIYGQFLDKYYNDERIYSSYTNMVDKK